MFHDSHVVKNELFLNPSTSLLELSCVIFHLKAFHWECCYLWCLPMIQVISYHLGGRSFHLFIDLKLAIVSVSGRLSPHNFEMFSISPLQAYSFRCWFSNNSVITFLEGCFPSSFVAEVGIFFSILLFQWSIFYSFFRRHCDVALFTHHLELWGSCSFLAYPFNRSVVSSLQYLFISSSFSSLFYRSAVQIMSFLFLGYLIIPRWSYSFRSWSSYFHIFQPSSSRNTPCSSFLTDCLQSRSSLLYSFF